MDVTEAKDINDHLILLQKNQKDIGNFFDNMYHFTSSKDDFLTSSRGYGCHRDEVFSEYFNNAPIVSIDTITYPVSVIYDAPSKEITTTTEAGERTDRKV